MRQCCQAVKPANHGVAQAVADMKDADDLLLAGRLADAVGRQRRREPVGPTRKGNCFFGLRALQGLGSYLYLPRLCNTCRREQLSLHQHASA